jgi:hypothetical protein
MVEFVTDAVQEKLRRSRTPSRRAISGVVVVTFAVTCAYCGAEVVDADLLGDEEEALLRDHLMKLHPTTIRPETFGALLRHFIVATKPKPAA